MKKILFFLFTLLFLPISIYASVSNNIYGIHLAQPQSQDLQAAANLVNSNGGKWGYVTLVMQENDRNRDKWQNIFDEMRELHLIPIIRLATQPEGENWRRPDPKDATDWVNFLDSLNWVVKNRYVILFNEPNHGSEWGGEVDEKSYAKVTLAFSKALKEKNKDFFVMLAGMDASAPSWMPGLEDEEVFFRKFLDESSKFLSRVNSSSDESSSSDTNSLKNSAVSSNGKLITNHQSPVTSIFDYIDGLASHSYPNPDFAGSPYANGRGTVKTYDWELGLLASLGAKKDLPVFITETGWKRGSEQQVSYDFQTAFQSIWSQDPRVMAVTPFVLDYQGPPFLEFSWKKYQSDEFYQQYYAVQSLAKTAGDPDQIQKGSVNFNLPKELVAQSTYSFRVNLSNQGQAVWDKDDGYQLQITNDGLKSTESLVADVKDVKPFEEKTIDFSLKTSQEEPKQTIRFVLTKDNQKIIESSPWQFRVLPLPDLNLNVNFWPFGKGQGNDFEVQLFDTDERLVFKNKGVKVTDGHGVIKNIQNIAIDEPYRAVILKPGYLPRQTYIIFKAQGNLAEFKAMLPFDFNRDGKFDFNDIVFLFKKLIGH